MSQNSNAAAGSNDKRGEEAPRFPTTGHHGLNTGFGMGIGIPLQNWNNGFWPNPFGFPGSCTTCCWYCCHTGTF